ncbi:uncharacterized protein LOC129939463 [Eupeodes corollae]|uniref:uncharacterized protein LOC129939463 n=1 Tax=Eupeodes corollae TaxID=290404 RepID=UPI0024906A38|nr:uncharacterized protein LOC129939463 [Eupeodes corollae]
MKKIFFSLLIATASWQVIEGMTESDAIGALESFGDKCDPKPNEDDYKNIIRNSEDVPQSTKCFRHCLMDQMNMLQDDCKLDAEKLADLTSMAFDGKEDETIEIAHLCNGKVVCKDKCEAAHDYAMCIISELKTRGWPLPELDKEE